MRPRKFRAGEVAFWNDDLVAIVDYRQDGRGRGTYRVIRLLSWPAGRAYGPAVWVPSHMLDPAGFDDRRWSAVRTYRANSRLIDRGCSCQCCAHEAIPAGVIRGDGTRTDEEEDSA